MAREHDGKYHMDANNSSYYDRVAERNRKYRRRRIIRRRIVASIILLLIIAFILFVISLFIRVKEIDITGTFGQYCYEDVLTASGIEEGDKLLYINTESVENEIEKSLPYMTNVKVKKRLFSKVFIEVDYCSEAYCLYIDGKYAVVSSDFKVLRYEENNEQIGATLALGLDGEKADLGDTIEFNDKLKLECFKKITEGLSEEEFGKLSLVDVTDTLKLRAVFKNGFEIKFGNYTNLDYNLQWAGTVTEELRQKHEQVDGTLDLSIFKKAYYTPRSGEEEPVDKNS